VEEESEAERRRNREIGIDRLGASLTGLRRSPGVDGVVTDPERDVAAIAS
jgi:hypothetical protein